MSGAQSHLQPDDIRSVINRLKRAQGQVGGVVRMLEEGRACSDVVTQLAAVHRAVGNAGFDVIALGMKECLTNVDGAAGEPRDLSEMRRLFRSLS